MSEKRLIYSWSLPVVMVVSFLGLGLMGSGLAVGYHSRQTGKVALAVAGSGESQRHGTDSGPASFGYGPKKVYNS